MNISQGILYKILKSSHTRILSLSLSFVFRSCVCVCVLNLSFCMCSGVVEYIKSGRCRNIIVMNGAGISVAAGIPDFRSPQTGLYHNLQKYDLPYPEAIFEIKYCDFIKIIVNTSRLKFTLTFAWRF